MKEIAQPISNISRCPVADKEPETADIVGKVSAEVSRSERWQHFKCRVSGFRDRYQVSPGLYAFGNPDQNSDVLVSANYKLSFDALRSELAGLNCWILVLDTKGINVWCAAGKGTFGTEELIRQITITNLKSRVKHRRLIVPQLGAVGVSATEVRRRTDFRVSFGPVRASDVKAYITAGYKKDSRMSTVFFGLKDRLVLTPMELLPALKKFPWFAVAVLILFGLQKQGIIFSDALGAGAPLLLLCLAAIAAGGFLTPALLPFLPFRSFALKGWIVGVAVVLPALFFILADPALKDWLLLAAEALFFPALSSYLALQFTGSTTYTGMTGVRKELRAALPLYIVAAAVSALLLISVKITEWGIL